MKLTLEQIKSITLGAVRIWEAADNIWFSRFTQEQMDMYRCKDEHFSRRSHATAGIQFAFRTDSKRLSLRIKPTLGSSWEQFIMEIHKDGQLLGSIESTPDRWLTGFSGDFFLGEGEKTIRVFFPWPVGISLEECCLDDGATITPVRPSKKLLMYGDSITQGYIAHWPSSRYGVKLAEFLDAEEFNRAIGGELYYAPLVDLDEPIKADYITIAYGTNDWHTTTRDLFQKHCVGFIKTVSEKNPQAQIFVITPVWRKDCQDQMPFGPFEDLEKIIRSSCAKLSNVQVVRGFDLIPKEEAYFADRKLHPNDAGFCHYAKNLCKELAKLIK